MRKKRPFPIVTKLKGSISYKVGGDWIDRGKWMAPCLNTRKKHPWVSRLSPGWFSCEKITPLFFVEWHFRPRNLVGGFNPFEVVKLDHFPKVREVEILKKWNHRSCRCRTDRNRCRDSLRQSIEHHMSGWSTTWDCIFGTTFSCFITPRKV